MPVQPGAVFVRSLAALLMMCVLCVVFILVMMINVCPPWQELATKAPSDLNQPQSWTSLSLD